MEVVTHPTEPEENKTNSLSVFGTTTVLETSSNGNTKAQSILVIQSTIASVGIVANLTVIVVFLSHKKLRRKIPNIFIINQVRKSNKIVSTADQFYFPVLLFLEQRFN